MTGSLQGTLAKIHKIYLKITLSYSLVEKFPTLASLSLSFLIFVFYIDDEHH